MTTLKLSLYQHDDPTVQLSSLVTSPALDVYLRNQPTFNESVPTMDHMPVDLWRPDALLAMLADLRTHLVEVPPGSQPEQQVTTQVRWKKVTIPATEATREDLANLTQSWTNLEGVHVVDLLRKEEIEMVAEAVGEHVSTPDQSILPEFDQLVQFLTWGKDMHASLSVESTN